MLLKSFMPISLLILDANKSPICATIESNIPETIIKVKLYFKTKILNKIKKC